MKTLLILFSYHHHNTEKIAQVFARVLDAPIKLPLDVTLADLLEYDLVGFGSGIYSAQHHASLLTLVDQLPPVTHRHAFIFSTNAIQGAAKVARDHAPLRAKLQAKGYSIVGEFSCKGFNTNSFLKWFGGMNKGRPNGDDFQQAEDFAQNLKKHAYGP